MGMRDQFEDKTKQAAEQAKQKMGRAKDEASERASRGQGRPSDEEQRRSQQEAQDRFDQDYDA
ncbi:hypothetical protein M5362_24160 [Streptomyces sp. Je 1-79]|uniref:hypothetical protein n=1 Tax=Streptomyces sp. Je 1-79 TaxID=2943847 RepID=UPI0021A51505|nr:hypothetical protein [Streptomyces sp. Je 1-79]MCT4356232.1 hypothetical protein [Streptomyces sp. Je 1-79]